MSRLLTNCSKCSNQVQNLSYFTSSVAKLFNIICVICFFGKNLINKDTNMLLKERVSLLFVFFKLFQS